MMTLPNLSDESWLTAKPVQLLLALLSGGDGEARVAGGAVRNALLGEPIADIDIATTLPPWRVSELATRAGMSVHATGLAHGTVTVVVHEGEETHAFEVTTLRVDTETDGRRAKIAFTDDWVADASRRDFTINAMFCDADGTVHDPLGGYDDLVSRTVRFAGDPDERITEDYLRILRFFRFHARYGIGDMDAAALKACIDHKGALARLSGERVRVEILKLLVARNAIETITVMDRHEIFQCAFPANLRLAPLEHMRDIDVINDLPADAELRLCVLIDAHRAPLDRLRLSNEQRDRILAVPADTSLSPGLRDGERKIVLYQMGADSFRDAVRCRWALSGDAIDNAGWLTLLKLPDGWRVPVFPLKGSDLIKRGIEPGPELGDKLRALEDWWMAAGFPDDRNEILSQLQV